ncbi:sigma-70 family RNA polymerase sigma factor [Urbifossiella limnaea]|uniref:ECF RNA polymerase sigma factor SigE n=1 Tax=Urbifossiella limnaea TaxID=2528023 RepID=A0A517XTC9_9BACT|nr:sigma-70 family RNA polymerase sigma factor [Urbifossiella limnaea]QDU20752.1 ECF RNA polymerase sigma factor SigE [Urbifossiella limnaea]
MTATRLPAGVRDLLRGGTPDADLLTRFVAARDEAAFAELVRRHGGPVWDVCRSVLRNAADADDAFQATFLTLARRADALRKPASVGAWLHGVAVRVSRKARAATLRRARYEASVLPPSAADPSWSDAHAVVHESLAALPERYREPLVACYLRGLTHDDTAAELGLSKAALKKRLERGRAQLRAALRRRGVGRVVLLGTVAVPAPLLDAATRIAAGAVPIPPAVLRLVEGGFSMTFAKFTAALVLAAGVGLAAVAQEQPGRTRNAPPPPAERAPKRPPPAAKVDAPPEKSELDGTWTVTLIETGGRPVNTAAAPDEFAQPTTFVIAGGRCEVKGVRVLHLTDFRVKTDPAAEPKQIDATMLDGPKQGETYPGIYAVDGDKLRICLRLQRTELGRPKGYSTTSGTTLFTFSLTRSKAAAVDPRAEVRFDDVLRSGKKLYLVLNGPLTKNLTDDLAPFAERLSLAVKTADRVKDKDVTVVLFRRFDAKTNDGILSGFTREQLTRYAAEGPARRIDKLAEHAWTPGRLPKDATPLPPEPAPPNAVEAGPELSARVVVRSDRVPPEPPGDLANARVGLDGRLELLTHARTPVRVVVTPSQVRVTIRGSGWSSIPPVQLGREGVEKEPPPRPRAVEVPPDGYVGLDTQAGQRVVITGRPSGADVHTGPHVWRLPPGRYRVEGEVDVTVGERPMTVRLEPTAFTIP